MFTMTGDRSGKRRLTPYDVFLPDGAALAPFTALGIPQFTMNVLNGSGAFTPALTIGNNTGTPSTTFYGDVLPHDDVLYLLGNETTRWLELHTPSIINNNISASPGIRFSTGTAAGAQQQRLFISGGVDKATATWYSTDMDMNSGVISNLGSPLTVPNGGTGAATFTSNAILKGAGTGAITTSTLSDDATNVTSSGGAFLSSVAASGPAWKFNSSNTINNTALLFDVQNNTSTRLKVSGQGVTTLTHSNTAATGTLDALSISQTATASIAPIIEGILITQTIDVNSVGTTRIRGLRWNPGISNSTSTTDVFGFVMAPVPAASSTWRDMIIFDSTGPATSTTGTNFYGYRATSNAVGTITHVWGFRDVPGDQSTTSTRTDAGSFDSTAGTFAGAATSALTDWYGLRIAAQSFGAGYTTAPNQHSISLAMDGNFFDNKYLYWGPAHTTALASRTAGIRWNTTSSAFEIEAGTTVQASWTSSGALLNKKLTTYNNIATAGWGVPAVYGAARSTAQTAAVASVATYTVGASDGSFLVSANVLVTTSTLHSFTVTCTYTDEGNTARTITLSFSQLAGTLGTTIANAAGTVPYEGIPLHIRAKASTAITIATTGTFTTVTYNVEGIISQIA